MQQHYITATLELLDTGTEPAEVIRGLQRVLTARDHGRLLRPVLHGVLRILTDRHDANTPQVRVINQDSAAKNEAAIAQALLKLGVPTTSAPSYVYDDTIIGGFVAEYKHTQVDASYKTVLRSLYTRIVSS